jgi:cytoskeleton protein RodZ
VESLGARFKRERERQKITLDQVAAATKIGTRMLKALEDDHFDQLPGGIFNKGFVRSYARHLSMDEEQAITDYLAATSPAQPIKEPEAVLSALADRAEETRSTERPGSNDGLPWDKLAAVLLLVAFGFALWGWRTRKQRHAEPAAQTINAQQSNAPAAVPAPAAAATSPPAPATAPGTVAPGSVAPATPPPSATPSPPSPTGAFLLLIQARTDSWIEVSADGADVLHELLPAGAQKFIAAQHEIVVKAGNVGGLDFTFNGKKLPAQGPSDKVKTLKFDPSGLTQAASPASATPALANPASANPASANPA